MSKDQISGQPEGLSYTIKGTRYKDFQIRLGALYSRPPLYECLGTLTPRSIQCPKTHKHAQASLSTCQEVSPSDPYELTKSPHMLTDRYIKISVWVENIVI